MPATPFRQELRTPGPRSEMAASGERRRPSLAESALCSCRRPATLVGVDAAETTWTPNSWRDRPAAQQPEWPDPSSFENVQKSLSVLPPLVFAGEARRLQTALAQVSDGRAFLLQAGDCAESFGDFTA